MDMLWVVGQVALALAMSGVAALVMWMVAINRQRLKEMDGVLKPPTEWRFFTGHAANQLKVVSEGTHLEWTRRVSKECGYQTWGWSSPRFTSYVVHSPEDLKHAFYHNFSNYNSSYRKGPFQDILGDGIFNIDGPKWKEQRRISSHMFTARQLKDRMQTVFSKNAQRVCKILSEAKPGEAVDIQRLMYCYTFDSINEIAFGRAVDSLGGNKEDLEFQQAFDRAQSLVLTRLINPFWKVQRLFGLSEAEREYAKCLKVLRGYISKALEERRRSPDKGEMVDALSLFEEDAEKEGRELSEQDLHDVVMNFLIAGRDTTASASTWAFWELGHWNEVRERLQHEAQQVTNVDEMQWGQAVFQETLRLHPSVPLDAKTAEKDDVLPSGTRIPAGTRLAFNPCAFTMNPALYPDPEKFLPSRWMEDDGTCKPYDQWTFPQFNMGPRICLGRHMAAAEAKTILAEVLSEFDLLPAPGFKPQLMGAFVLQTRNGMMMTVHPRQ